MNCSTTARAKAAWASLDVKLTGAEIAALAQAFPLNVTAGTRYPEKQLKALGI